MEGKRSNWNADTEPVPSAGRGFFPLNEELGLDGSDLTPLAQEGVVRLASWMTFGQSIKLIKALLGVQVSRTSARRLSLQAGEALDLEWKQRSKELQQAVPSAPVGAQRQVMSADGAMVPLVGGVWAEVKTLALGTLATNKRGEVQVKDLSYCSRLCDVAGFEQATLVETHERGLEHATTVAAVMDGAEWLQGLTDYHRADAVRILDCAHAAEYGSAIGEAVRTAGSHLPENWLSGVLHRLKHEGPERVLTHLSHLASRCDNPKVGLSLQYLSCRVTQMQYPRFQAAGLPIGSGTVESANKLVVEKRLKGAGMHWKRENVDPMLILRNVVCNDRWDQSWQRRLQQGRTLRRQMREHKTHVRLARATVRVLHLAIPLLLCRPSPTRAVPPPASPPPPPPKGRTEAQKRWGRRPISPRGARLQVEFAKQ